MTILNPGRLGDALRAGACGIDSLEAGTGLLIDCASWLHRDDFTSRFITVGPSISDGVTLLASIDWETAVAALHAGELPASGGERRMLLWPPASSAGPSSASTMPCPASTAATRASSSALSPMPPGSQIHIKKRINGNETV
jgi:hypothetical protein